MKILVFGGAGFIGNAVCQKLQDMGYDVSIFDRANNYNNDITNYKQVYERFRDIDPDIVYNFAGIHDIEYTNKNPRETIFNNIMGDTSILEAIANTDSVQKYIYASSLYVYARGNFPYAIGKRASESLIRFYANRFGFKYAILRYGTVYGPGAKEGNSIYNIISRALKTKEISYYGSGDEVRQYVHISDVAKLSIDVMVDEQYDNAELILAGAESIKARDMCYMLQDILGKDYKIVFRNDFPSDHYKVTPFAFQPDVSQKLIANPAIDFAGGVLEVVKELYARQ